MAEINNNLNNKVETSVVSKPTITKSATNSQQTPPPTPQATQSKTPPQTPPQAPEEKEHHYELNALGWALVVIATGLLVWIFVFGGNFDFNKENGISEEILAARIAISEGKLGGTPFATLKNAFSLDYLPLPDDGVGAAVTFVVVDVESEEYGITRLEYLSPQRIAEAEEQYRDWAVRRGYEALKRNTTAGSNIIILDILDGTESVITAYFAPSGKSSTKISIAFPLPPDISEEVAE